jgi:type II secretory pathway pseudopilin PulG
MKKLNKTRGAILLESLLAIVVFTIIIMAIVPMLSFLLRRTDSSRFEVQAAALVQESLEVGYNEFANDWQAYPAGVYHPTRGPHRWRLKEGDQTSVQTRFNRSLRIQVGCRNAKGELTNLDSNGCNDIDTRDQNTKILTARVEWEEAEQKKDIKAQLILVNYEEN